MIKTYISNEAPYTQYINKISSKFNEYKADIVIVCKSFR